MSIGLQNHEVNLVPICTRGAQKSMVRAGTGRGEGSVPDSGHSSGSLDLLGGKAAWFSFSPVVIGKIMKLCARCMRRFTPFWKTCTGTSQRLGITSVSRLGWEGCAEGIAGGRL